MEYRTLLVPLDFSDDSAAALQTAVDLARRLGAKLKLLHVYHRPTTVFEPYGVQPPPPMVAEVPEAAKRRIELELDKVREAGVEAEALVREGLPAEEIAAAATELGADLIVMGTRGLSGLKHVLLGSVAERTLRSAPCPVLSVRTP
jgi:nucleotide-binding universal stress UspA family protein